MLLRVPGHSGIKGSEDSDALAIPISPCVDGLEINEWLTRKHPDYWV
jgi:hypothetical protein